MDESEKNAGLKAQTVGELRRRCKERGLDCSQCLEKKDLIALLLKERSPPASTSATQNPAQPHIQHFSFIPSERPVASEQSAPSNVAQPQAEQFSATHPSASSSPPTAAVSAQSPSDSASQAIPQAP